MTGRAVVLRGDAARLPLPDESVDLIVTSPPFWKLRSYTDGGVHYPGQLGSESTPREFIAALLDCTQDWVRVLKPSGSLFVELGDTYAGKSRLMLPARYVIGCTDFLGLYCRQEIIWDHVNVTPESVADRARTCHTVMYHLTKRQKYYAAIDVIRSPGPVAAARNGAPHATRDAPGVRSVGFQLDNPNPLGRSPGSVWAIPSAPLVVPDWVGVEHFAAFPPELVRRAILGWSPPGICTGCGQGRFPVTDKTLTPLGRSSAAGTKYDGSGLVGHGTGAARASARVSRGETYVYGATEAVIAGWACACTPFTYHPERRGTDYHRQDDRAERGRNDGRGGERWNRYLDEQANPRPPVREYHWDRWDPAPTRPGVVLDPFGGSGTVALVASVHGRTGICVDRSADYCRLATWRTADPGERARALGVPRPPAVPPDQIALFELPELG